MLSYLLICTRTISVCTSHMALCIYPLKSIGPFGWRHIVRKDVCLLWMLSGSFKATSWQSARKFLPNDRIIAKPLTCHLITSRWSILAFNFLLSTLVFVCQPLKACFQLTDILWTESVLLLRMESTKFSGLCNLPLNLFQNGWNVVFCLLVSLSVYMPINALKCREKTVNKHTIHCNA